VEVLTRALLQLELIKRKTCFQLISHTVPPTQRHFFLFISIRSPGFPNGWQSPISVINFSVSNDQELDASSFLEKTELDDTTQQRPAQSSACKSRAWNRLDSS